MLGSNNPAAKDEEPISVAEAVRWAEEHLFDRNSVVLECQVWQEALGRARGEKFSVSELTDLTRQRDWANLQALRVFREWIKTSDQSVIPLEADLTAYAGDYWSSESETYLRIHLRDGQLVLELHRTANSPCATWAGISLAARGCAEQPEARAQAGEHDGNHIGGRLPSGSHGLLNVLPTSKSLF